MAKLKAINIEKKYKGRIVVRNINIEIESGNIVGILGPNGAGKTTCFYIIVGLIKADNGNIFIDNKNISRLSIYGRSREGIGYLPQEASIFRKLNVNDNILSILEMRKDINKQQQQEVLEKLLNEFNISNIRNILGIRLSGGERRRVEIARALAISPKFLLLDEPFYGIDPISVVEIKNIIENLKSKGIGILITDHNVRETLKICYKAYIINNGEVIAEGNAQSILSNDLVKKVYLGENFTL